MIKPDIVEVIGERVELRWVGKELFGLCPFHDDRHPSLRVNAVKQVWYCHPCATGGDVFHFIMRADGLSFSQAKKALGIDGEQKPRPTMTASRKSAAERAAAWANDQRAKLNFLIGEHMEQRDLADEIGDFDLAELFDRETIMLRGFYDALKYPRGAAEMLAVRTSIEQITADVEMTI